MAGSPRTRPGPPEGLDVQERGGRERLLRSTAEKLVKSNTRTQRSRTRHRWREAPHPWRPTGTSPRPRRGGYLGAPAERTRALDAIASDRGHVDPQGSPVAIADDGLEVLSNRRRLELRCVQSVPACVIASTRVRIASMATRAVVIGRLRCRQIEGVDAAAIWASAVVDLRRKIRGACHVAGLDACVARRREGGKPGLSTSDIVGDGAPRRFEGVDRKRGSQQMGGDRPRRREDRRRQTCPPTKARRLLTPVIRPATDADRAVRSAATSWARPRWSMANSFRMSAIPWRSR